MWDLSVHNMSLPFDHTCSVCKSELETCQKNTVEGYDLYDSLRETDEQTYFDLNPPGVSRDPQFEGPSTSSDVPMTPVPAPDESMPERHRR